MKKKVIWIVIAILIIIAALIGILYYTTDLFKTPEQLFYKHFGDASSLLGKINYEDAMDEIKKQSEESIEVSGEITANVTSDDEDTQAVAAVLEKGKITYDVKTVGTEQKMQNDITLNYDGKDIVTLNILRNQNQYGVKIAEAYDKYVSVENNNLKALFSKLGVDTTDVPDRIETIDYYDILNIDQDTLDHIKTTYSDIIKQNVPTESYSVEKGVMVAINGTNVTTNAYKLTLTEKQLKTVLVKVLETLKSDDTTLDLFISKYDKIMKPYKTMGMAIDSEEDLTKEDLISAIEDELTELNETTATANKALEVVVYATKDGKAKITMIAEDKTNQVAQIEIDMIKLNSQEKKMIMTCLVEDTTMKMEATYSDEKAEVDVEASEEGSAIHIVVSGDKENTKVVMTLETEGTTVEVNVKQEVKDTENVTVEDFTSGNSVKLNDMTESEIQQLVQDIYTNVMEALPQKMELLGINNSSVNSLL